MESIVNKMNADDFLLKFLPVLEERFEAAIRSDVCSWEAINNRFRLHFPMLFQLYAELYSNKDDFDFYLLDLLTTLLSMWFKRPRELKELDVVRENDPLWFQSNQMLGGVCYVDLFAGNLEGIREKIPYFNELGLTYLHLMPLFKVPEGENDGGYAVSSYREVNPNLGTMEQLIELAADLRKAGISLVLDFVFNHTSNTHKWALMALDGSIEHQDYYRMFPDREFPDVYEESLREIFPDEINGITRTTSFTYVPQIERWVWTTFHSYQWDLNYENPIVFNRMVEEMLFLANIGVEVLRLDAVAFIWKRIGTNCENLPEAHKLIQAFNAVARIASPVLLFKSEAIVHPDEVIKYISRDECQLSYNPLLMALIWNSLATREVRLLKLALHERFLLPEDCAWVNYIRSHDDIGWTFSDEDAQRIGINAYDHRKFLNEFYTGAFEGSFARGLVFQENPITSDARISGTCASLAGLEKAIKEETKVEVELAIRRILLIYGVIFTAGGIPLIYLGDEIGTLNDYSFFMDDLKAIDSRWVHRPYADWRKYEKRKIDGEIGGEIYKRLHRLIKLRKENSVFSGNYLESVDTGNEHVLCFMRAAENGNALILANFSERKQEINPEFIMRSGLGSHFTNLLAEERIFLDNLILEPYDLKCIIPIK